MTKIHLPKDCGNSPRQTFLKEFNIAFAKGDADYLIAHVSDSIAWHIHGKKTVSGKDAFSQEIKSMKDNVADEMILHGIITHGKQAAAHGELIIGGLTYAFCDVYQFAGAKGTILKEIHSYVMAKKGDGSKVG
jgi:hypothetical protein